MRLLIIHQNFPGQFRHMAEAWSKTPGWQVIGLGRETAPGLPGVTWYRYRLHRAPNKTQHHYLRQMENAVLHGQAVARALIKLKQSGFTPDVILAHPGWGETLYAKDVFPDARLIHFCEWYYGDDADFDFDPEFPASFDDRARIRSWNALHLLNLENCDVGVTPTRWQWSRHPAAYRDKIRIIHEGIDTANLGPDPNATLTIKNGKTFKAGEAVVTYVARNLEPYRGFHSFLRALEILQKQHKHCHTLIVGGDDVSYGQRPKDAKNWREQMLREVKLDPERTHFLGKVPYESYKRVLQVSAAHVYLTYPFVLSWSMLEAIASGCVVIGSKTPPVAEIIRDRESGLLVDFFDRDQIAERIVETLDASACLAPMRAQAMRELRTLYDRAAGSRAYEDLARAGKTSTPANASPHRQATAGSSLCWS